MIDSLSKQFHSRFQKLQLEENPLIEQDPDLLVYSPHSCSRRVFFRDQLYEKRIFTSYENIFMKFFYIEEIANDRFIDAPGVGMGG